jgi:hypothetical protein
MRAIRAAVEDRDFDPLRGGRGRTQVSRRKQLPRAEGVHRLERPLNPELFVVRRRDGGAPDAVRLDELNLRIRAQPVGGRLGHGTLELQNVEVLPAQAARVRFGRRAGENRGGVRILAEPDDQPVARHRLIFHGSEDARRMQAGHLQQKQEKNT